MAIQDMTVHSMVTSIAFPWDEQFGSYRLVIYDPCHPNDPNYVTFDANLTTTIVMDNDRQVTLVFGCGSGLGPALPLAIVGVCVLGFAVRRGRGGRWRQEQEPTVRESFLVHRRQPLVRESHLEPESHDHKAHNKG